jgi:hypothetical protein
MKNILYALLTLNLLASCQNNTASNSKSTDKIKGQTQRLITKFKPIIQGSWIDKGYIREIGKTKSPFLARKKMGNITTMLIDTKFLKDDTLRIDVGYGNHEGGEFMLKFQPGKTNGSIIAYSATGQDAEGDTFELKYKVTSKDTTLAMYTFDKNRKLIDATTYLRVFRDFEGKELGNSTYYMVNKTLITGHYLLSDTLNKVSKAYFDNNGTVTGIPGAKTYFIDVDFETPPGNNMDQIDFDINTKNDQLFAFKFDHDTLNLFNTKLDKDSINLILGKRVYMLIKQH